MSELKQKVEAILYTVGRFQTIEELSKVAEASPKDIVNALEELKADYSKKDSALTIQEVEGKFKLNIKKEHAQITNKLLADTELDHPTTKTLAVIAYKSPVFQSEIIKVRGNKAYDHIKSLREANLITADKSGRTNLLKLTPHFYDYFDTAEKQVKETFHNLKQDYPETKLDLPGPYNEN